MANLVKPNIDMGKGFYAIGIDNPKTTTNIGTLIRSAKQFNASFVFTIGEKYQKQSSAVKLDTKIPIFNFKNWEDFKNSIYNVEIVGVEITDNSTPLKDFKHPKTCIYILGSEDSGLSKEALSECDKFISIEGNYSLNVSVAGSIIMYERINNKK